MHQHGKICKSAKQSPTSIAMINYYNYYLHGIFFWHCTSANCKDYIYIYNTYKVSALKLTLKSLYYTLTKQLSSKYRIRTTSGHLSMSTH